MKVLKFGGTSVGSAERMKHVAALITSSLGKRGNDRPDIVVLSAMSGDTNTLSEIAAYLYKRNVEGAKETINKLEAKHLRTAMELLGEGTAREEAEAFIHAVAQSLTAITKSLFSPVQEKIILSRGELISTKLMYLYLRRQGVRVEALDALSFMRLDAFGEPDADYIKAHLLPQLDKDAELFLTQGYICTNIHDETDNLQRGGSDYSASLIGAAAGASEIQIWTDIDGMHNNDPRVVDATSAVRHLSFDEAAELAYFGAKILHPTCILPAKFAGIPVRLLNTMNPEAPGTVIDNATDPGTIKAVAAKDNITAIKIKSSRMLLAHGFLRKVFEIFESYRTPIDMICTSEVEVSMSIDDTRYLGEIVHDLKKYGTVSVDPGMCIICVVGDMDWANLGFVTRVMSALEDIPVRMVSYGGSNFNISLLVRQEDKEQSLKALSEKLF